jgi:hypothetical protein
MAFAAEVRFSRPYWTNCLECFSSNSRKIVILRVCDVFIFRCSLRPESSQEHLPTSIAGVLRLRATSAVSPDQSMRRSAQDDDFVGGLEYNWLNMQKTRKDRKKSQPLRMTILWEFEEKHPK